MNELICNDYPIEQLTIQEIEDIEGGLLGALGGVSLAAYGMFLSYAYTDPDRFVGFYDSVFNRRFSRYGRPAMIDVYGDPW